jgi:hypothetical protein
LNEGGPLDQGRTFAEGDDNVTDAEKEKADSLLARIETAVGELPDRSGTNSVLIAEILHSVNGLRSLIGIVRPH